MFEPSPRRTLMFVSAVVCAASAVRAIPVTVQATTIVAEPAGDLFPAGEIVLLSYTFETDTPEEDSTLADPDLGVFLGGLVELSATFQSSGLSFVFGGGIADEAFTCNDTCQSFPLPTDALQFFTFTLIGADPIEGSIPYFMSLLFLEQANPPEQPVMLSGDAVPTVPFAFDVALMNIDTPETGWSFTLLPVPEPGAGWLVSAGLIACALWRRASARKRAPAIARALRRRAPAR